MLRGNLFDSAIMKTSVISKEFRDRYLFNPKDPERLRGPRHRVRGAGGLSRPHRRCRRSNIDEHCMLFVRGAGPIGYPGGAEVVNMQPPAALIKKRHHVAALHRRRTAIRHVGLAVDPQCVAGSGRQWRARDPQDRRPGAHRSQQGRGQYPDLRRGAEAAPRRADGQGRLPVSRPTRRRGRSFIATPSASRPPAPAWSLRRAITTSPAPSGRRGTITEQRRHRACAKLTRQSSTLRRAWIACSARDDGSK